MRRRFVAGAVAALVLALGAGAAYSASSPALSAHGPGTVEGTAATAVFKIGDTTVRQIRYADRKTLDYSFVLANDGVLPITVSGLAPLAQSPTLFEYSDLTDADGNTEFTIGPRSRRTVTLSMLMTACERLSARAGSFASEVRLRTTSLGSIGATVLVTLPEEIHTGSPREASCPRSTSSSRPAG